MSSKHIKKSKSKKSKRSYSKKQKRQTSYSYYIDSKFSDFNDEADSILSKSRIHEYVDIFRTYSLENADIIIRLVDREDAIELIKKSKVVGMEDIKNNTFFSWVEYTNKQPEVNIDYDKWTLGSEINYGLSLKDYRKTLIQHEFLHALGYAHVNCNNCTKFGNVCPLMFGPSKTYKSGHIHNTEVSSVDFTERLLGARIRPLLKKRINKKVCSVE